MNARELTEIIKTNHKVIVKFEADWCQPCKDLSILMNNVVSKLNEPVKYLHVDIENSPELLSHFGIKSVPFVIKYQDGELVDSFIGVRDEGFIESFILADGKYTVQTDLTSTRKFF